MTEKDPYERQLNALRGIRASMVGLSPSEKFTALRKAIRDWDADELGDLEEAVLIAKRRWRKRGPGVLAKIARTNQLRLDRQNIAAVLLGIDDKSASDWQRALLKAKGLSAKKAEHLFKEAKGVKAFASDSFVLPD